MRKAPKPRHKRENSAHVPRSGKPHRPGPLPVRARLKMPRRVFARMLPISERSLAAIEAGQKPNESVGRRVTEITRVVDALCDIVDESVIGEWFQKPNTAFDGLKPLEVIERGEIDRLWEMIYFIGSGTPS